MRLPRQTRRATNAARKEKQVTIPDVENIDLVQFLEQNPPIKDSNFDENDQKIINATLKAMESGTLTPLIKEELRCTIQSRRLAEGKEEMKVEFKTPVRKKEMDEEERVRSLKRRQQNREAATRFRQKQKDTSDYLSAKIRRLEKSANALSDSMANLREEKELLSQMLKDHLTVCSNPQITDNQFLSQHNTNNCTAQHHQTQSPVSTTTTPTTIHAQPSTTAATTHNQAMFNSTSSYDSNATYGFSPVVEYTPDTARSDTSSVFFPNDSTRPIGITDDNESFSTNLAQVMDFDNDHQCHSNSIPNPTHIITNDGSASITLIDKNNSEIHYQISQEDLSKFGIQLSSLTPDINNNNNNNINNSNNINVTVNNNNHYINEPAPNPLQQPSDKVMFYEGGQELDLPYEEVVVDYSTTDNVEFLDTVVRARGDSCSSVDTVSSVYGGSSKSPELTELTPISEQSLDISAWQVPRVSEAYSGLHDIIGGGCNKTGLVTGGNCDTDFFLMN